MSRSIHLQKTGSENPFPVSAPEGTPEVLELPSYLLASGPTSTLGSLECIDLDGPPKTRTNPDSKPYRNLKPQELPL